MADIAMLCRTCMECLEGSDEIINLSYELDIAKFESAMELVKYCVPELNANAIPNPVMCKTCWNIIGTIYNFKKACIEAENNLVELLKANSLAKEHDNAEDNTSECGKDQIKIRLVEISSIQDGVENEDSDVNVDQYKVDLKCLESDKDEIPIHTIKVEPLLVNKTEAEDHQIINFVDVTMEANGEIEDNTEQANDDIKCEANTQGLATVLKDKLKNILNKKPSYSNNRFKCLHCPERLPTANALTKHYSSIHNMLPPTSVKGSDVPKSDKKKCCTCGELFSSHENLESHFADVHNSRLSFYCEDCRMAFVSADMLEQHNNQHKEGFVLRSYSDLGCSDCDRRFMFVASLRQHLETVHNIVVGKSNKEKYKCQKCEKRFVDQEHLDKHVSKMHQPMHCQICYKQFPDQKACRRHLNKVHDISQRINRKPQQSESSIQLMKKKLMKKNLIAYSKTPMVKVYKCDQCGKVFTLRKNLQKHKTVHTENALYSCKQCGRKFSAEDTYKKHTKVCGLQCDHCDGIFESVEVLRKHRQLHLRSGLCFVCGKFSIRIARHVKRHNGVKTFVCKSCNKAFLTSEELRQHEAYHSSQPPFLCDVCGKAVRRYSTLQAHKRTHTGEKPFVCEICGKRFTWKRTLEMHGAVHDEIRRFPCELCEKLFRTKSTLTHHMKTHTNEQKPRKNGSRTFTCSICGATFPNRNSMWNHGKTHRKGNNYVCNVCDKEFNVRSNLMRHKMIHNNEKPFECNICHKLFRQKFEMEVHRDRHEGKKPFNELIGECAVCGVKMRNRFLKKHMDVYHAGAKYVPKKEDDHDYESVINENSGDVDFELER